MRAPHRKFALASAMMLAIPAAASLAEDADANTRIREEGMQRSQVMQTLHHLTDRYGPRLTGSPNLEAAGRWAVQQMEAWGLENGHLEGFDFGHPGWLNERSSVYLVSPVQDNLVAEVLAWTPGTAGAVRASAMVLPVPAELTSEDLEAHLSAYGEAVRGQIVLVGEPRVVPVSFEPETKRRDAEQLRHQLDPATPPEQRQRRRRGPQPELPEGALSSRQVAARIQEFLVDSGAAVQVNDAAMTQGHVRAFSNRTYDPAAAVPTIVLRNEDYGRIARLLGDGEAVQLEVEIVNRWFPEGTTAHNAVAELTGSDRADEVIVLGAHLDSWHSATGATDNAAGSAVMMEAARILASLGEQPRRTIRVALWGGEEQGLLGSQAYVAEHFGSFEDPKPGYEKFAGAFNIDAGTGQARGASVFGPPAAGDVMREILAPFEDLGVLGAIDSASRRLGGSDHTSFDQAGLPGIVMSQDPIEYFAHTWHTNLDTYERIVEDDVKISAVVIAAAAWALANRDELLPRFSAEEMPALPASTR